MPYREACCRARPQARWLVAAFLAAGLFPSTLRAQTDGQLWGTLTLDWAKSDRLTYRLELEPKALVVIPEGEPGWLTVEVTPTVERAVKPWLDLVGEVATGYTAQTDDLNSFELSPRAGLHFHLFSRSVRSVVHAKERPPKNAASSCAILSASNGGISSTTKMSRQVRRCDFATGSRFSCH